MPRIVQGTALIDEDDDIPYMAGGGSTVKLARADQVYTGVGAVSPLSGNKLRYVHLGDSITLGDSDARNNYWSTRDLVWATAIASGGRLLAARNAGVGGQTSPQMAQRVVRDVLLVKPDVVGVTPGSNDVISGGLVSSDYIGQSLNIIANALRSAGVYFFLTTIPPYPNNKTLTNTVNRIIRAVADDFKVRLVDHYTLLTDPADDGEWIADWDNNDEIHPHCRTTYRMGVEQWRVIREDIEGRFPAYTNQSVGVPNLLMQATTNTGLPSGSTTPDPLFINSRAFSQNSFNLTVPYLFATQFGSGTNPTVSGAVAALPGIVGKAWTITAAPNGAGSYSVQTTTANRPIDVSRYQGRRLRFEAVIACSGFDTDNTDAVLSAAASVPVSGWGIALACLNAAGTAISNTNIADPVDATPSLGQASSVPCEYQAVIMAGPSSASHKWCVDLPLTPIAIELNVPVGALQLQLTINVNFTASAVSTVNCTIAQISVRDVGPSFMPQIPRHDGPEKGYLTVTAATTLTAAQIRACPYIRCDATSAAFALTLPAAGSVLGFPFFVKKIDSSGNAVTITRAGSDTIDGATTLALSSQYAVARLHPVLAGFDVY